MHLKREFFSEGHDSSKHTQILDFSNSFLIPFSDYDSWQLYMQIKMKYILKILIHVIQKWES